MRYRFSIASRRMDLDCAFQSLDAFQSLVSDAIAREHSDSSLEDLLLTANAKDAQSDEWRLQVDEQSLDNERTYDFEFPQLAIRGVFLAAILTVEDFLRFLANQVTSGDRETSNRELRDCRQALLDNWNDANGTTEDTLHESSLWQELRWHFEVRNLLMHVDERSPTGWNNAIRNAIESLRCPSCKNANVNARKCCHLVAIIDHGVTLGAALPKAFIDLARKYIGVHFRHLP